MLAFLLSVLSWFPFQEDAAGKFLPVDTVKATQSKKTFDHSQGKFVQVNRVVVMGNNQTRDRIILRELSLKPGDIVHTTELESVLDLDKKKLINTRLFNTVEIRVLDPNAERIDLIVDVTERWYTFPAPIFELSDRNFNEWW